MDKNGIGEGGMMDEEFLAKMNKLFDGWFDKVYSIRASMHNFQIEDMQEAFDEGFKEGVKDKK